MQQSNDNHRMMRSALLYAQELKWAVFPLNWVEDGVCSCNGKVKGCKPGKHPLTKNGVKDATTNEMQIRKWWTMYPKANIGIACGKISGVFVLDVDIKPEVNGHDTIKDLETSYEELPQTPIQLSGSGGTHYFFKNNNQLKNGVEFLPGLDIRSDGGYIIGAPSSHISGRKYTWDVENHILKTRIVDAPNWLIQAIIKNNGSKHERKPADYFVNILRGIGEGARNNSTASLSGFLLRKNIDPAIAFELIKIWNETRCNPPLTEGEVEKTFISILQKDMDRKKGG